MFAEWVRSWMARVRLVRKAARCLEDARSLRRDGRHHEALSMAREGLRFLGEVGSRRRDAAAGTALVGLTILVEELGQELGQQGAERADLMDSLAILDRLDDAVGRFADLGRDEPGDVRAARLKWIPYLRSRLET